MRIEDFSGEYAARKLGESDIDEILSLCKSNRLFYKYHPPFVTKESALNDMKFLPPGKTNADKLYFGFFSGDKMIALTDLILRYPDEQTAFIGLFMVDAKYQGQGAGSRIVECMAKVLYGFGFSRIRLAREKDNPQSKGFWRKNKFVETGEIISGENGSIVIMERKS